MAKVTAKYQITIPPEVRTEFDIVPGCEVDIRKKGSHYVLVVDPIAELKKKNGAVNLETGKHPMST